MPLANRHERDLCPKTALVRGHSMRAVKMHLRHWPKRPLWLQIPSPKCFERESPEGPQAAQGVGPDRSDESGLQRVEFEASSDPLILAPCTWVGLECRRSPCRRRVQHIAHLDGARNQSHGPGSPRVPTQRLGTDQPVPRQQSTHRF